MKTLKHIGGMKNWIFKILLICIFTGINIMFINYIFNNNLIKKSGNEYVERDVFEFTESFISKDDYVEQTFNLQHPYLESIKVRMANNSGGTPEEFVLLLTLLQDGKVIKQEEVSATQFDNWTYYNFVVQEKLNTNKECTLKVQQIEGPTGEDNKEQYQKSYVLFHAVEHAAENSSKYSYNGNEIEGELETVYIYKYVDKGLIFKLIIVDLSVIAVLVFGGRIVNIVKKSKKVEKVIGYGLYGIWPFVCFCYVEIITGNIISIQMEYWIRNLIIYYIAFIVLSLFLNKMEILFLAYTLFLVLCGLVQYFVTLFRGKVFMIQDIFAVKTAMAVADTYVFAIPYHIFLSLAVCICCLYLLSNIKFVLFQRHGILKKAVFLVMWLCLILGVKEVSGVFIYPVTLWNVAGDYAERGLIYTLLAEVQYIQHTEPENYSINTVKEIINGTEGIVEKQGGIVPENILIIMNETFSDLEYINTISTDTELLPYMKSMQENVVKGYLSMPEFGGGTANSEYEVLTGNNLQFLTAGTSAYEMNVQSDEYGLASTLEVQGYKTVVMHPFGRDNWNRPAVYNYMGFDEFLSEESWENPERIRWCISDKSAYDKLIEVSEETDGKLFTFLVTIQNHGGYATEYDNFENEVELNYEKDYPQAEQYLSLIQESDRAFQSLIEYFEQVEEPTMIVMFGDHLANVEQEFYEELFGKPLGELSIEEIQKRFMTPFVIWTNYDIPEEENIVMSANYFGSFILQQAGVEMTEYNEFLLNLREEIPVIRNSVICDKDGNWYKWDEMSEEDNALINQYKILQYNNVFDRKERVDEVFKVG